MRTIHACAWMSINFEFKMCQNNPSIFVVSMHAICYHEFCLKSPLCGPFVMHSKQFSIIVTLVETLHWSLFFIQGQTRLCTYQIVYWSTRIWSRWSSHSTVLDGKAYWTSLCGGAFHRSLHCPWFTTQQRPEIQWLLWHWCVQQGVSGRWVCRTSKLGGFFAECSSQCCFGGNTCTASEIN